MKVRIALSYSDLARFVQQQLETEGLPAASGSLARIEITASGPIQFFERGGRLESRLPLRISAGLPALRSFIPGLPGGIMRLGAVEMHLMVEMSTGLELGLDLQLQAQTQASYSWLERPTLGLALLKVPVDTLLDQPLRRELGKVARQIDTQMIGRIPVRTYLEEAWQALHQAYVLEETPLPLHLLIRPVVAPVHSTALFVQPSEISLDLFLPLQPTLSLTPPPLPVGIDPLPAMRHTPGLLADTGTNAYIFLGWDQLGPWLCQQVWPLHSPITDLKLKHIEPRLIGPDELDLAIEVELTWKLGPFQRNMQGIWHTRLVGGIEGSRAQLYLKGPYRWSGRALDRWLVARLSGRRWQELSHSLHSTLLDLQEAWIGELGRIAKVGLPAKAFHLHGQITEVAMETLQFTETGVQLEVSVEAAAQVDLQPAAVPLS